MAKQIKTKGIIRLELSKEERIKLGFGPLCDQCNDYVHGHSYYFPVLGIQMCKQCKDYYEFKKNSLPEEDKSYQDKEMNRIKNLINIEL